MGCIMNNGIITKEAALRIAVAARTLDGVDVAALASKMGEQLGLPITVEKLSQLTVADLKLMLTGEETVEPDVDPASIKLAVRQLWGDSDEASLPQVQPYQEGDMPGSLRVAVASNSEENVDGHFGSCPRFLIYQVGRNEIRLTGIRPTAVTDEAEDKNTARAELLNDCQIVYVQSIGGPAAAKAVRANIHPVKVPEGGKALAVLQRLQAVLDAPPPWLAKMLGQEAKSLGKFAETGDDA